MTSLQSSSPELRIKDLPLVDAALDVLLETNFASEDTPAFRAAVEQNGFSLVEFALTHQQLRARLEVVRAQCEIDPVDFVRGLEIAAQVSELHQQHGKFSHGAVRAKLAEFAEVCQLEGGEISALQVIADVVEAVQSVPGEVQVRVERLVGEFLGSLPAAWRRPKAPAGSFKELPEEGPEHIAQLQGILRTIAETAEYHRFLQSECTTHGYNPRSFQSRKAWFTIWTREALAENWDGNFPTSGAIAKVVSLASRLAAGQIDAGTAIQSRAKLATETGLPEANIQRAIESLFQRCGLAKPLQE